MTKISSDSIASVAYTLQSHPLGEVLEQINEKEPAQLTFKPNQLLPAFEKELMGLKAGDTFDFIIKAEDGYGNKDPYAVFDIPKDTFEEEGKIDEKMLEVGNVIPMTDNNGNKHLGKVVGVQNDAVTLDFNHPLAGIDLRFLGKIIDVRLDK